MRLLFCLLGLVSTLAAAPRTCRILFLGAPDGAPETLQLFDGTTSQEVELPRMNLSPVYKLPSGPLTVRMLTAAPAKPADVSPDAPKAVVPETVGDFYLLVSTDPANKIAPVRFQVIDVDPAKFSVGQMLWFNLTPNSVGGLVGSEKLAMAANSRTILKAPARESGDYNVKLTFRMPNNERLYPLCETKWQFDSRARTIFFVIAQDGNRTPRVLGFPDYREPAESTVNP